MVLRRLLFMFSVPAFAALIASFAAADWVWEPESGWLDMSQAAADSDRGLYAYGRGLSVRGDYAAAAEVFAELEKKFPDSPLVLRAKFEGAKCEARLGHPRRAIDVCKELLVDAAEGPDGERIASFLLETFGDISDASPLDKAHDLCFVADHAPVPALRRAAYFAAGEAFFEARDYDMARLAFDAAIEAAPDDERRNAASLQIGLCDLAACREGTHDETRLRRALEILQQLEKAENEENRAAAHYVRAIRALLRESDPERRTVYYAATYLPEQRYELAYPVLRSAARRFRGSPAGEAARFYQAECLFLQDRPWKAFKLYETLLKEYPATSRITEIVEREFAIAKALAQKDSLRRAAAVFEAVVNNNPTGSLADDAEMALGRQRLRQGRHDEAKASFQMVFEQYPNSDWADAALFFSGVADLNSAGVTGDNERLLESARSAFEGYLWAEPNGDYASRARGLVRECDEKQAAAALEIARFYKRRGELRAEAAYYHAIISEHPGTPAARRAGSMLTAHEKQGVSLP